jgi:hypothetical protein
MQTFNAIFTTIQSPDLREIDVMRINYCPLERLVMADRLVEPLSIERSSTLDTYPYSCGRTTRNTLVSDPLTAFTAGLRSPSRLLAIVLSQHVSYFSPSTQFEKLIRLHKLACSSPISLYPVHTTHPQPQLQDTNSVDAITKHGTLSRRNLGL